MTNNLQIKGMRFGKLIAIKPTSLRRRKRILWKCICDCGNSVLSLSSDLKRNAIRSCGCLRKEIATTHGMTGKTEYRSWNSMKNRCYNINYVLYKHYGGRGIKVCNRWLNSFENFLFDMGSKPSGYSLDRINNDGNYEPTNCRWATAKQQANNRRPKSNG